MKNGLETLTGFVVIGGAALFAFLSYNTGYFSSVDDAGSYQVKASFGDIGTLGTGADVRISGVKIGKVEQLSLNSDTYRAAITMRIDNDYTIPDDSSASIVGDGLLGGKYIQIIAGGSDDAVAAGGTIAYTQDAVSLESLIGKFAFGSGDDKKEGDEAEEDSPFN